MNPRLLNYCLLVLVSLVISAFCLGTNHAMVVSLILGAPGGMLGVLMSPHGAHGGWEVDTVAFIANSLFYFLLFRFLIARRLFKTP